MAYKRAETTKRNQPFKIVSDEIPAPPPGSVRVKVAFAGVCHSDVHMLSDVLGFGEEKFKGIVMGHEISGYLDEAGEGVDLSALGLKKGDPVMVYPWVACQNCDVCRTGYSNVCPDQAAHGNDIGCSQLAPGGYQTHILTKPQYLLKVPDTISLDVACMLPCSVGTSYAALRKLTEAIEFPQKCGSKARLLIIGAGGLGLWAIQLAKVMFGPDQIQVVAADIEQTKLERAKKFGADETVLWSKDADIDTIVQNTIKNGKMHAAVDFVSNDSSSKIGVKTLNMNGGLVFVGLAGGDFSANSFEITFGQLTIRGNRVFTFDELKSVVNIVTQNKISYPALEYYPLEQLYDVLQKLKEGKISGRALIKY